ncbi:uncharacterized protein LOC111296271 [Durio zibethinus]|uniref:Uncharacterized protein LOC111296271 n=1 Tax=Durio zibethinus TaxID=66656 RepID=A0A6P5Z0A3_DURZI|nr:uncharacterized protein LOC111296271 [Durio zibethinus]
MAEQINDTEFWLPAKFLTDDDVVMEKENLKNKTSGKNNKDLLMSNHGFPTEFPHEFDSFSALSSPVETIVGSTESDKSDEDEFLAGLTCRLAHSTSQKLTVPSLSLDKNEKTVGWASSPQSTLSGLGGRSGSSNGSPYGPSQVPSPPTTPFSAQNGTWDLIYVVAGHVARLQMSNEAPKHNNFYHGRDISKTRSDAFMKNSSSGLYSSQSLSYNIAQRNQYHGRQEQVLKPQCKAALGRQVKASNWQAQLHQQQQQQQQIHRRAMKNVVRVTPLVLPQCSWPPLQVQSKQQPQKNSGSGMRAVFRVGSGGVKRECAGTGVFLPRRYGNNTPEPCKKSSCSTALLPANVVQAFNLNFNDSNRNVQPHFNASFASNHDALVARRNAMLTQARRNYRPEGGLNHEACLPQEWTY